MWPVFLFGQARITTEEYIEAYKEVAIKKMKEYQIPASITLAQGILESGSGNSRLAKEANNHFGIKCHQDWTGKTYTMDDDEKNECFRKYPRAADSYSDHSLFLTQRGRYSFLFEYDITDYEKWAYGLKKAGYATNPKYPELLIGIIERYDLAQYDTGIKKEKKKDTKQETNPAETTVTTNNLIYSNLKNLEPDYTTKKGRKIYLNNNVKFIYVAEGDNFYNLADEFDIYSYQLFKYNEVDKKHVLQPGEMLYLEKKKSKAAKTYDYHVINKGESLQYISQLYGIRLNKLMKMNHLSSSRNLPAGKKIKVR